MCVQGVVIGTHQEKGCTVFWSLLKNRFQLEKQNVTCWKTAMVVHKMLRVGHPNVSKHTLHLLFWKNLFLQL